MKSKEEKIARLQKVVAGAKQRAEEGGGAHVYSAVDSSASADAQLPATEAQAKTAPPPAAPLSAPAASGAEASDEVAAATTPTATISHTAGQPDRTLMKQSTYAGIGVRALGRE